MNRRAGRALRLLAGVQALAIGTSLAFFAINRWFWTGAGDGSSFETLRRRIELVLAAQRWTSGLSAALFLAGLGLLLAALEGRGRALATGAVVGMTTAIALMIFQWVVPPALSATHDRWSPLRQALGLVQLCCFNGSSLLALLAGTPAGPPRGWARRAIFAFVALTSVLLVLYVIGHVSPPKGTFGTAFHYVSFGVGVAGSVTFVVAALGLARGLTAPEAAGDEAGSQAHDPRPLRLLGHAIIVRTIVGVPLAAIAAAATVRGAAAMGQVALMIGTVASIAVGAMLVTSFVGQRRFPEAFCNRDALALAIGLACVGPAIDVWGAISTGELLSAIGEARRATSFWGMPSLSRIERLQAIATWTGRASIGLGFIGSFAVVRSLAATAAALGDETLIARARRVQSLLIYGAGAAITTLLIVGNVALRGESAILTLLLIVAALLSIGIVLLIELLRLAFGLAAAFERPAPAPPPALSAPASS